MALPAIFCPQCDALILEAEQCSTCNWQRPIVKGNVGQPVWAVALETALPRKGVRPVAANGIAYFPTDAGQVVAVDTYAADPEATIKWRYRPDQHYRCHGVAVWEDYILPGLEYTGGFPKPPADLLLLSAENASEVWRYQLEGASYSVPAVHNGIAYFTVNTGWLLAIDLLKQQELWRQKIDSPWSWIPVPPRLTPSGLLLLPSRSNEFVAFDIEKRSPAWAFSGGEWFSQTPAYADGIVYALCWDGYIYAIDESSGREVWRYKPPRNYNSDMWVEGDYLYAGVKDYQDDADSGSRSYALYTLNRHTGERVGRYEVTGHIIGRPVATDGAVYFATDDRSRDVKSQGTLYALDAQGQQLLWEPYVAEQRFLSDLLLVGDLIIAGTREGAIYAVRWRGAAKIEAPQHYIEQEAWDDAVIAYARQGEYIRAAEIYAGKLGQPLAAGRLYLHAGEPRRVLDLLGQTEDEAERALAVEAAQTLPEPREQAEALRELGDPMAAAQIYIELEDWFEAGACYEAAQAWEEARAVYFRVTALEQWADTAWERWEKVTRKLGLWDDLIKRLLNIGQPAKAARIYADIGRFKKAAEHYEEAQLPVEALAAFRQIDPEKLTPEVQTRMARLAEQLGQVTVAIDAFQKAGKASNAANLAEQEGHYEQALTLFREAGRDLKAAEMLEKMKRYVEAAAIFEQQMFWGKAAENLEQQVDQVIEQAGELRRVRGNAQIEGWLTQAADFFEEEGGEQETKDQQAHYYKLAERCRKKLAKIKREPVLAVRFQVEALTLGQSCAVRAEVENVGWGSARNVTMTITSLNIQHQLDPIPLGVLRRDSKATRMFTVVPKIAGAIMLQVNLQGLSRGGEQRDLRVAGGNSILLDAQARAQSLPEPENLGGVWDEESAGSSTGSDTDVVSKTELNQQRIASLKRARAQHHKNLNKLQEDAARYGASDVPLRLHNEIEKEKEAIAGIKKELEALEA